MVENHFAKQKIENFLKLRNLVKMKFWSKIKVVVESKFLVGKLKFM